MDKQASSRISGRGAVRRQASSVTRARGAPAAATERHALVPKRMFFTKGVGVHRDRLTSFELSLRDAGVATVNLVPVSSIFPTIRSDKWLGSTRWCHRYENYVMRCRKCAYLHSRWVWTAATAVSCQLFARRPAATNQATKSSSSGHQCG